MKKLVYCLQIIGYSIGIAILFVLNGDYGKRTRTSQREGKKNS